MQGRELSVGFSAVIAPAERVSVSIENGKYVNKNYFYLPKKYICSSTY